jgi:hypothetical protein
MLKNTVENYVWTIRAAKHTVVQSCFHQHCTLLQLLCKLLLATYWLRIEVLQLAHSLSGLFVFPANSRAAMACRPAILRSIIGMLHVCWILL